MASTTAKPNSWKTPSIIPGFGLTFGIFMTYMWILILLPIAVIFFRTFSLSFSEYIDIIKTPTVSHAIWLSLWTSMLAALINVVFGLLIAWVLVRYNFPGRRLVDACIDLPFALPTAVAGIAFATLYSPIGWLGSLLNKLGISIINTSTGIVIALIFIGIPFVVRTIQPAIAEFEKDVEEAAASLGANRLQTFIKVILPALLPSIMTGFALAFGRAIGEYGSVIFIAGNLPRETQIAPLMIVIQLEGNAANKYANAAAIGATMLVIAFIILLAINLLQAYNRRRFGNG
ncbi:sulfate ABC transporter permease subunit CysT [Bartonella sp. HY329]|uniref:sulfate ABC transporter permease subunit CysT n=1 Tax=unclassified Bartonella TaxID=2645622 RepID=UPI0021C97A1F|nr:MULTISPECIES: sulfate ABC transporter permease subunit CysT [unclassified Bartonella]UXM94455.1 sulfate ABC transporter permease subunit CysT [Bartonella sp. HY329]UXN08779.1 sulfate ABC transporter permease subunit CysT [Bartonella sp. HY328]